MPWKLYNTGYADLAFLDKNGKSFNGEMKEFLDENNNDLTGLINQEGRVILINNEAKIVATGKKGKMEELCEDNKVVTP